MRGDEVGFFKRLLPRAWHVAGGTLVLALDHPRAQFHELYAYCRAGKDACGFKDEAVGEHAGNVARLIVPLRTAFCGRH